MIEQQSEPKVTVKELGEVETPKGPIQVVEVINLREQPVDLAELHANLMEENNPDNTRSKQPEDSESPDINSPKSSQRVIFPKENGKKLETTPDAMAKSDISTETDTLPHESNSLSESES